MTSISYKPATALVGFLPPVFQQKKVAPVTQVLPSNTRDASLCLPFLKQKKQTPTKEQAALRIQRAWRFSQAGLSSLRKDGAELAKLPHSSYKKACQKLRPILKRGSANPVRARTIENTTKIAREQRETYQNDHAIPVITSAKEAGKLPKIEILGAHQIPESFPRQGPFRLQPNVTREQQNLVKSSPITKEKLDELVKALLNESDLFPWEYRDGCYARAQLIIELLVLAGVDKNCLEKQFVCVPTKYSAFNWRYHVAVRVNLRGKSYIIDPSLGDCALSLDSWIKKQKKKSKQIDCEHMGLVQAKNDKTLEISYNPEIITTFRTSWNTETLVDKDNEYLHFREVGNETYKDYLQRLSRFRLALENNFLKI